MPYPTSAPLGAEKPRTPRPPEARGRIFHPHTTTPIIQLDDRSGASWGAAQILVWNI